MKALNKLQITLFLIALSIGLVTTSISCADVDNSSQSAKTSDANEAGSAHHKEKPVIAWYHNGKFSSLLSLKTALSSGLITHVGLSYMHRNDEKKYGTWESNKEVREAIAVVRKSGAKLIWSRSLWPWYVLEDSKPQDLFDPNYYIREIKHLRTEARKMRADFVALDTEPYANSVMRSYMKGRNRVKLSDRQHKYLERVIENVIQTTGKVDFIWPAGSWGRPGHNHPYDVLARLGRLRVAENTYYDNDRLIKAVPYPYEIFGMHANTAKENKIKPGHTFFLAHEIFEKSHLWSGKKGVWIYTSRKDSLAVAKDLVAYSRSLPSRGSAGSSETHDRPK